MQLTFNVNKQTLNRSDDEFPASGSKEYLTAKFTFSDDWNGTTKTAVFSRNSLVFNQILDNNGECKVPHDIIIANGAVISVFGTDGTKRITTTPLFVRIDLSGYIEGSTPAPPTPTVYEQIIGKLDEVKADIPNVPLWALEPEKPTYTASEVGALPDTADENYVHKSGDETINGTKTFTGNVTSPNLIGGNTVYGGIIIDNLNNITKNGFYTCYGTAVGAPNSSYSWFVIHQNSNAGTTSATQRCTAYGDNSIVYERKKVDGIWKSFILQVSRGEYDGIATDVPILKENITELVKSVGIMRYNGIRNKTSTYTRAYVEANKRYIITYDGTTAVNCFVEGYADNYVTLSVSSPKAFIPTSSGFLTLYKSTYDNSAFVLTVEYENSLNRRLTALEIAQEYHVGQGKQFTSFTACIKALANNTSKKTVYVHSGIYDIFNEIGGANYTLSITEDGDWRTVCNVIPPNTNIIGLGEVVFNFMPTAEQMTVASAHMLSPINISGSCSIENITINADNCRYGIHDETSGISSYDGAIKKYKNIIVNKFWTDNTLGNPIPFGCGFGNDMEISFDCCQFNQKRNTASGQSLAFHNNGDASNTRINIVNCALTGTGKSIKFGSLTNNSSVRDKVFISNCYLENNILLMNEANTLEKTNAFDITMVGCSNVSIEDTTTTNPYQAKIYRTT